MPRGGAASYRKGADTERKVKRAYEADGWLCVRSPKSGSEFDLMCVKPPGWVDLTQCKSKGYIHPKEKEALLALTDYGAPVLAWIEGGVVKRRDLRGGELEELPLAVKGRNAVREEVPE